MVVRFPTTFEVDRNGCWPSRGSQLSQAPQSCNYSFAVLPSERPQKGSTQSLQNRLPISSSLLLPLSFPHSYSHFSSSLHERQCSSQPWPRLFLLVFAGNITWRGRWCNAALAPSKVLTTLFQQVHDLMSQANIQSSTLLNTLKLTQQN